MRVDRPVVQCCDGGHYLKLCVPDGVHAYNFEVLIVLTFYLVYSFIGLVEYVFTLPDVSLFLSNRICQDPVESFFGHQRQRGRVNENPSVQQFVENTRALRVINGTCSRVRGNCRGSAENKEKKKGPEVDNSILPKRKTKHK